MTSAREDTDGFLVIACGNPLRSDDGVAWRAAEEIRRTLQPPVRVICVHQLTPELAEEASRARTIVFIDATGEGEPGEVLRQRVVPDCTAVRFSHHFAPAQVLALCKQLYGTEPRGFVISVSGECFDHGEELSPAAIHALPRSVAEVKSLARDCQASAQLS